MEVKGVQGSIRYVDGWITIRKKEIGSAAREFRIRAADVTGTRLKPGTWAMHGYVQFVLPGSAPAPEKKGVITGGRPPQSDPHSLSIPRRSNEAAAALVAAVERDRLSR
ncbi:DUF4429 domain-containing protein [Streptomyces albus]|uniref:DUF4429 domain-containing protein n=1 Tax=Streptomyces sp. NRRL F-5917 TaxID=1463873 RepID=UPI0004C2830B|nr:DUF4429 domain-containing protein [Streptomyces sp. NRRL F-5917]